MNSLERPWVAVVPISLGDRQAPAGTPAFRIVHGICLLARAVGALSRSDVVGRIVVAAPGSLGLAITDLLSGIPDRPGVRVEVLAAPGPGPGHRLRFALQQLPELELVLVHEPLYALAPATLVADVATALAQADPRIGSAVPVRAVTDTLKWVDEDDVVDSTAQREEFRMVYSPQAYRAPVLREALAAASEEELADPGAAALPRLLHRCGGHLVSVPAPPEVFSISTDEDVQLAEAMLQVGLGQDDEARAVR